MAFQRWSILEQRINLKEERELLFSFGSKMQSNIYDSVSHVVGSDVEPRFSVKKEVLKVILVG